MARIQCHGKNGLIPDTETAESTYRYWDYMTPEFFALYGELCLWHGDYQKTVNVILNTMNAKFASTVNDATQYMHNVKLTGTYIVRFGIILILNPQETVSAIIYNYQGNQTNSLLKHFGTESPNEYLLAPSQVGMERYTDPILIRLEVLLRISVLLIILRKIKVVIMLSKSIVRQIAQRVPMLIKMMCIFIFIVAVSCISCWRRLSIIWDV